MEPQRLNSKTKRRRAVRLRRHIFLQDHCQVWAGHGMGGSTEDPRTWESSRLRRILRSPKAGRLRPLIYGILANRRTS